MKVPPTLPPPPNESDADRTWDQLGNIGWQLPSLPNSVTKNRKVRLSIVVLGALLIAAAASWLYYDAYGPLSADQKAIFNDFDEAYTLQELVSSATYDSGQISAVSDADYESSVDTIQNRFPDVERICEDHPNRKWTGDVSSCDALEYWVSGILLGKLDNYQLFETPARSALSVLPDYAQ